MINNELDSEKHPLLWVGVDFAGPFYVTLFTCCMTGAVHLELVEDLLASTFRCCLRRFFTRYEAPADRIRQCKDLSNESIKYAIQPPPDKRGLEYERIEWKLNLERALWWGRFFERMVASVKDCLRKHNVTQGCPLTNCRLCSQEVESTTKSRPLTYKYNDIEEVSTPSHALWGRDFRQLVFVIEVPKNPQGMSPVDAWKKSELMLDSLLSQGGECVATIL